MMANWRTPLSAVLLLPRCHTVVQLLKVCKWCLSISNIAERMACIKLGSHIILAVYSSPTPLGLPHPLVCFLSYEASYHLSPANTLAEAAQLKRQNWERAQLLGWKRAYTDHIHKWGCVQDWQLLLPHNCCNNTYELVLICEKCFSYNPVFHSCQHSYVSIAEIKVSTPAENIC